MSDQTLAIFRTVEIFRLVEPNWSDQLRGSEIRTIEIGVDDDDSSQVGSGKLGSLERGTRQVGALE